MLSEEMKTKIDKVLKKETHESIVLSEIIKKGSTTVRDLLPFMNYPCGPIRGLQSNFGIRLEWDWETKEKTVSTADGKEKTKKVKYKRYKLAEV